MAVADFDMNMFQSIQFISFMIYEVVLKYDNC